MTASSRRSCSGRARSNLPPAAPAKNPPHTHCPTALHSTPPPTPPPAPPPPPTPLPPDRSPSPRPRRAHPRRGPPPVAPEPLEDRPVPAVDFKTLVAPALDATLPGLYKAIDAVGSSPLPVVNKALKDLPGVRDALDPAARAKLKSAPVSPGRTPSRDAVVHALS